MICSVQLMLDCSLLPVYARFGTMSLYRHIQKLEVALCFHSPFNHIASGSSIYNIQHGWICKKVFLVEKHIASNTCIKCLKGRKHRSNNFLEIAFYWSNLTGYVLKWRKNVKQADTDSLYFSTMENLNSAAWGSLKGSSKIKLQVYKPTWRWRKDECSHFQY